jgi:predicted nucleic acid-binding protein
MRREQMDKVIISDTSTLLAFYEIGEMSILQRRYGKIVTTPTVQREFQYPLPSWVEVSEPTEENVRYVQERFKLDLGETTAIALALSHSKSTLIIDEMAGRRAAQELGIEVTGTLGILLKAKKQGIISAIRPLIQKLQNNNFRMSETLIAEVLIEANERIPENND